MQKDEFIASGQVSLQNLLLERGLSLRLVRKMLKNKDIRINGKRTSKDVLLQIGDKVEFYYTPSDLLSKVENKKINIDRVYEDENVLIINKPKGIETCGESGIEGLLRVLPVHRLDRNTSGLEVFAKNIVAKESLDIVFRKKLLSKVYLCEVVGDTNFAGEIYSAFLFKDAKKAKVIVSSEKKQGYTQIQTKFMTISHGIRSSIVECELLTGKTHQIRAHLAFLGHAIVGDGKYGKNEVNKAFKEKTQKLCCVKLAFAKFDLPNIESLSGKTFEINPYWEK